REPTLVDAFRSFTDQAGVPLITADMSADRRSALLVQSRYRPLGTAPLGAPPTWKIPLCVTAYADDAAKKFCSLLSAASGELSLGGGSTPRVLLPNAGGSGYYRFALDDAGFDALAAYATRLPAREAIVLADSVGAGFDAGRLSLDKLTQMARALANHPDRTPALMLGYKLADIHDRVASPAARPALERLLNDIYEPR